VPIDVDASGPIRLGHVSGSHDLRITWHEEKSPSRQLSYPRAVADYLANYTKANEPLDLSLGRLRQVTHPARVGDQVGISSVLTNTGGAGWLDRAQQPVLYVDGERQDFEFPAVSRGVGFDTPQEVIAFDHLHEGRVALDHTLRFCATGEHLVELALGPDGPRRKLVVDVEPAKADAPAPKAEMTLDRALQPLYPGDSATVTATIRNPSCERLTGVEATLVTPDGWEVRPETVDVGSIEPGASATATLTFTAPADDVSAAVDEAELTVRATYGWSGTTTGVAEASLAAPVLSGTKEPYSSHASTDAWFGVGDQDELAIYAGGEDMWKSTDEFGTLYLPDAVQGSTTVTTRVLSQGDTWPWAKAGLVLRNDLSAARSTGYVILAVTPGNGWAMQWDRNGDGLLDGMSTFGQSVYPSWLRLEREGTRVTGSYSTDGETWHELTTASVPGLADGTDAGVFVTATNRHVPGAISGVTFDGLDVTHE
jgi:hypothetical protein